MTMHSLADTQATTSGEQATVRDYADDGRWLWMHRRNEGHGPSCPDIACADFRKRLGLPPAPDWRNERP